MISIDGGAMDEEGKKRLWEEYAKDKCPVIREKIILEYAPLVKIIAGRLSVYLGYTVDYDDLVGYGIFGLIDAIDKFDTLKEVKFETYASVRIRGSILDQIRKMDWIPRTIRQKQKKIDAILKEIEMTKGRSATDEEIALALGISNEEYIEWQSQLKVTNIVSLDEFLDQGSEVPLEQNVGASRFEKPEESIEREELKKMLMKAIDSLTEKEKKVILLYYYEELNLKEISLIFEVSESRISQLHTKALDKMKVKLGSYIDILTNT